MNIAILTNFQDFNPGYSLTGIVEDQVEMLVRHGNKVHLFVCENYNDSFDKDWECEHHRTVPFGHLTDYKSEKDLTPEHVVLSEKVRDVLLSELRKYQIDIVFTHDWVFTGWNLPYARGVKLAGFAMPQVRWLHWVHSVPSQKYDWWKIKEYGRTHKIIFPNGTDAVRVAEAFQGELEDVRIIPHIKDPRSWYWFDSETRRFIDDHPNVLQGDIIQVYPASTDRLESKRIGVLIDIFGAIKQRGLKVCLVIANQWAAGREEQQPLKPYYNRALKQGLVKDEDFVFTSDWDPERYGTGIPRRVLQELQLLHNLFVFPTREESFGLVGPEAAMSGAFMVLNRNLDMMREVFGNNGLQVDFGSFHNEFKPPHKEYYRDIAIIILGRMYQNESIRTRTFCRKAYNYDALYIHIYEPLLMESKLWAKT
jgi:glycosyltransferase involved in cell wall biosynthesis